MQISYERYYDKVLGGWIGKCIGGTIGDRFEGNKNWIEIEPHEMFPARVPPNDDLDLQVLWLKVLEEKGADLTSDDLAEAWLEGCWYPFNEYGIFRRNYRLDIRPPESGRFGNQFWETGMGCPIRAEIWGYSFPGAPDLAARFARKDGVLDHTEQAVGAEEMFAAMAAMAFFVDDVTELAHRFIHYLPEGTPIEILTREAFRAHADGLSLKEARQRILLKAGTPEACDARINVPFTFLGLLYGGNDLTETMLATLRCGYDTDCTMATAGALLGQILGASQIPQHLKDAIGDELVMGIQYRRDEMTVSALARDTTRIGVLVGRQLKTGIEITDAPAFAPLPPRKAVGPELDISYDGLPAAAPGDVVGVTVKVHGPIPSGAELSVTAPEGWEVFPKSQPANRDGVSFSLRADGSGRTWSYRNGFNTELKANGVVVHRSFGVAGAALWKLLGVFYDAVPAAAQPMRSEAPSQNQRRFNHHFLDIEKQYLPEPVTDIEGHFRSMSRILGVPAVVPSYENEIDLSRLIGLEGCYTAYLARTVVLDGERWAFLVVGHTDAYRLFLNGDLVGNVTDVSPWTPFNRSYRVKLKAGENVIVVKLCRRSDALRFTLGIRNSGDAERNGRDVYAINAEDWAVDFADVIPQL